MLHVRCNILVLVLVMFELGIANIVKHKYSINNNAATPLETPHHMTCNLRLI